MWRLFRVAFCRYGICLLLAVALSGCDWDASSGTSSGSSGSGGSGDSEEAAANEPDTTPPIVQATSPEPGSRGVERAGVITAQFNEDIFASTVTENSFTLIRLSDSITTPGDVSFDADSNTAGFSSHLPLAMLETYSANLSTDITDLEGNALAEQYSWSFTAADGEWQTAGLIESNDSGGFGSARAAQVALDADGRGLAVWEQFQGSRYKIWSNRYDGSAWGTPGLIESNSGGAASGGQLAMNASGQAFAVWQQDNSSVNNIWANRFAGGGWGAAGVIQTNPASDARDPQIAIAPDGKAMAVWAQFQATCHKVWARPFDGSVWGAAQAMRPEDNDSGGNACESSPPQVSIDSSGRALIVWAELEGVLSTIWTNRFDGNSWGSPRQIQANTANDARTPSIAMTEAGEALVVWAESDGFRYNIWANHFENENWGTAERIETDNTGTAQNPQIAVGADGQAIAVWQQYDGSVYNIVANRYDSGSWGEAAAIETDTANGARNPQVAVDGNGRALAVWEQFEDGQYRVWANRYAEGSWGEAGRIEEEAGSPASAPQVAFDGAGKALAVWHQFDGARDNIWANRFE